MTDGVVQVAPNSTGAKIDTSELTVGSNTVERQRVVIADDSSSASVVTVGAKGTQGTYAVTTQHFKDAGRTPVSLFVDNIASVTAAGSTMISSTSATLVRGGTTSTTSGGSFTVTSGKTFRITSFSMQVVSTAVCTARVYLRSLFTTAATVNTSPVIAVLGAGGPANQSGNAQMVFGDGYEIGSLITYGLSAISNTATALITVTITGFEY